jgi:hypothetical protein
MLVASRGDANVQTTPDNRSLEAFRGRLPGIHDAMPAQAALFWESYIQTYIERDLPQPDHPVLAGRLGVEAMTLTRHVGNLKALVDGSVYPVLKPSMFAAQSFQLSDRWSSHSHQQLSTPALKPGIVVVAWNLPIC